MFPFFRDFNCFFLLSESDLLPTVQEFLLFFTSSFCYTHFLDAEKKKIYLMKARLLLAFYQNLLLMPKTGVN